jgi:ribosomal protein S18 acetylase RimI-like enzyme
MSWDKFIYFDGLVANKNFEARPNMISRLEHSNAEIADHIFSIFQQSYKVEAQLIGAANFPPLSRSAADIAQSESQFYGFSENACLAAVIEIVLENECLDINSLTVSPDYFRKGIASKLIHYVLGHFKFSQAVVETAVGNLPAIQLYQQHSFVEYKRWTPSHGIEKLAMSMVDAS